MFKNRESSSRSQIVLIRSQTVTETLFITKYITGFRLNSSGGAKVGPAKQSWGIMIAQSYSLAPWPRASVVIPTLNEARNLPHVSGHCPLAYTKS